MASAAEPLAGTIVGKSMRMRQRDNSLGHDFADDLGIVMSDESYRLPISEEVEILEIHAEQVQDGGLVVVCLDDVFGSSVTDLVGVSVGHASANAAAGKPHAEALPVVIAATFDRIAFDHRQSPDLTAPVDQHFIQHAALFEVLDECGRGTISSAADARQGLLQIVVVVPRLPTEEELEKADSPLDETSRNQAACAVFACRFIIEAVHFLCGFGFLRQIESVLCRFLHASRQFITGNSGLEIVCTRILRRMAPIEFVEKRQVLFLDFAAKVLRWIKVEDAWIFRS